MSDSIVVGVDIGTSSIKVEAFDKTGTRLWSGREPLEVESPRDGWFEQDLRAVYWKVEGLLRELFRSVPARVVLMGLSSTSPGLAVLDSRGEPVGKSILWMDRRAVEEAREIERRLGLEHVYRRTGLRVDPIFTAAKILWFLRNSPRPEASFFVQPKDYVFHRLTGERLTDYSSLSETLLYTLDGTWFAEMLDLLGVSEDSFFAPEESTRVYPLRGDVAERLGATGREVYVALGGVDSACAALGSGGVASSVVVDTTGTSACLDLATERPVVDRLMRFESYRHVAPGRYLLEACTPTGGEALRKALELVGDPGGSPDAHLDSLEPSGLLVLPFLSGSRSPDWRPWLRGAVYGLSLATRRNDLVKAFMEGVALWERAVLESVEELGFRVGEVRAVGGGATLNWARIKANVTGRRFAIPAEREASALGAALLAGVGYGVYRGVEEAVGVVRVESVVEPDEGVRAKYERVYSAFRALWEMLGSAELGLDHDLH
ncbi:xylulokinase [Infirmifilum sp. NZ]|uniref:xylulokinase n=1 Tax=Infirmifilum sp. NZ TaxID=2926850 RepID=UPI0027AA7C2B|nr:FGGY family carbohydrate kinase [Infirmifilum sp. NZ]UNQ73735.1 FGGY family carbohydrate kinase [Infirmifilum sp. NZ]